APPLLVGQRGDHRLIRGRRRGQLGPECVPRRGGGRHRGGTGAGVHPRGVDLRGQCCVIHVVESPFRVVGFVRAQVAATRPACAASPPASRRSAAGRTRSRHGRTRRPPG